MAEIAFTVRRSNLLKDFSREASATPRIHGEGNRFMLFGTAQGASKALFGKVWLATLITCYPRDGQIVPCAFVLAHNKTRCFEKALRFDLDIEFEEEYVTVFDDVFLTLRPQKPSFFYRLLAS
jgi:hypothetical protein